MKIKFLIFFTTCLVLISWYFTQGNIDLYNNFLNYLPQILGLIAFVFLSFEYIIAARYKFIEKDLKGFDKAYRLHHQIGGMAYILILFHPLALILRSLPNTKLAASYFIPGTDLAYTFGFLALSFFTLLIFITFYLNLPYHIWKLTHNFMGIPLIFVMVHVILIERKNNNSPFLLIILIFLFLLAFISYIYKRFLYYKYINIYSYVVKKKVNKNHITEFILEPLNNKKVFDFYPGQYTFINFDHKSLKNEFHPFSISISPNDKFLRFSIKESGDYTNKLNLIDINSKVRIKGPYGVFGEKFITTKKDQIWIAGGIGITPFLSMIDYAYKNNLEKNIHLIHSLKNPSEEFYTEEIQEKANSLKNFNFTTYFSDSSGFLTAEKILNITKLNNKALIFICGPAGIMNSLRKQFKSLGFKNNNIIFEDFSFR